MSGQKKLHELRIVLVGKTGVGKSATGNTILRGNKFNSRLSSSSVTSQCQKVTEDVDGRQVAVIDTPGLFDTKSKDDVIQEIKKCICFSSPGPHAFLVVLQLGRFTQEEQDTVKIIQETFGSESSKYTIVLFTQGDRLMGTSIEEFLGENQDLVEFTRQCYGGCHVFNNNDLQNHTQASELLEKIDKMVTINGGRCYSNEMYETAEEEIQKKKNMILEENKNLEKSKAREQAEKDNAFLKRAIMIATGSTAKGAAAGLGVYTATQLGALAGSALGSHGRAAGAAVGAGVGIKLSEKCFIQ